MINGILAVFGLGGGELLILLAVVLIGFAFVVGIAVAVGYFVIRMLSRKSQSPTHAAVGSHGK